MVEAVQYLGLVWLGVLALNVWLFLDVLASGASRTRQAVWGLVLLVPVLGAVAWYLRGPRRVRA